jgi:glycine betaine/proline transport system substrate-binding protein
MNKAFIIMAAAAAFVSTSANADCGKVTMAGLSWGSASILGEIDKQILESKFGCEVEMVPGGTVPSFTSMNEKQYPDIMGELWPNAAGIDLYNKAIDEGRVVSVAEESPIGGVAEGWYILPNILETNPELTTLEAVLNRPDLFPHYENKNKGGFVTCPPGSGCQISNANLFVANKMKEKGWEMVEVGSYAAEDATISKAAQRGETWFGYYSAPTAFVGKYNLVKLDWGVGFAGQDNWNCITKPDCPNPKPSSWTESFVRTIFTDKYNQKVTPEIKKYFASRVIPGDVMNSLLLYMEDNQATPDMVAEYFIENNKDTVNGWLN